jgi:hypothetical protein
MMAFVFAPEMSRVAHDRAGPPGPDGWRTTVVPIESIQHGHLELLKFGAGLEVLAPAELRDRFRASARELAALYGVRGGSSSTVGADVGDSDGSSVAGRVLASSDGSADGLPDSGGVAVGLADTGGEAEVVIDGDGDGLLAAGRAAVGSTHPAAGRVVSDSSPAP